MEETKPESPEPTPPELPAQPTKPEKAAEAEEAKESCGPIDVVTHEIHEVVDHVLHAGKAAEEAAVRATKRTWTRFQKFLAGLGISSVGLALIAVLTVFLILRFYGLPPQIKAYVIKELEGRGIAVSFDKLLLDPTGAILAERLSVFRTTERQDLVLQVDEVRLGIAWFSWWRGQPLLQSATVRNAAVHLPITPDSTVNLTQVNARVDWNQGGKGILIRQAQARLLNLQFDVHGQILIDGPLPARPAKASLNTDRIDALWQQIVAVADDFDTQHPVPVRIDFALATSTPQNATVRALVSARNIRWRGVLINELEAGADLQNGEATLSECRLKLARGEFTASGEANLKDSTARFEFFDNLDFTPLASALSPKISGIVAQFRFDDLPAISGRATASWAKSPLDLNVQADVDWENFSCGETYYDRLVVPLAYDGQRCFIPEARLEVRGGGKGSLSVLWNRGAPVGSPAADSATAIPSIRGKLDSTIDPSVFFGLFGPAADAFLGSLWFDGQASAPVLAATLEGASADYNDWLLSGHVKTGKCSYKQIPFDSFDATFAYRNRTINVQNFTAKRKEGTASGSVQDDFANRIVRIPGITTNVVLQEIAPVLGAKFAGYVAPYIFDKPPKLKVSGVVDLDSTKPKLDTDLTVGIDSDGTLSYKIYKIPFPVEKTKATLRIVDRTLDLKLDSARIFDGALSGAIRVLLNPEQQGLTVGLHIVDGDFHKAMYTLYKSEKETGRLNFQLNLDGILGQIDTFKGSGNVVVDDGYIMSIPFLGGLSTVAGAVIPGFGSSKADQGKCSFTIGSGVLHTDDLTVSSAFFIVLGGGSIDFANNNVSMDMRVNLRGIMSFLGYPLSKLFEYHGSGSLESLEWKTKNL